MNRLSPQFKIHYQAYDDYELTKVYIVLTKQSSSYFQHVIQLIYIIMSHPSLIMLTQTNGSSNEAIHDTNIKQVN